MPTKKSVRFVLSLVLASVDNIEVKITIFRARSRGDVQTAVQRYSGSINYVEYKPSRKDDNNRYVHKSERIVRGPDSSVVSLLQNLSDEAYTRYINGKANLTHSFLHDTFEAEGREKNDAY